MTTTLTSNEGEERLNQIRKQQRTRPVEAVGDIEFLLSLIDSQAAGEVFVGPCVHCGHNNFDVERKECKQRWMEGRISVVCGCPCANHNSIANAATEMRNKCVEKVRAVLGPYELEFRRKTNSATNIVDYVVMALEALPLGSASLPDKGDR